MRAGHRTLHAWGFAAWTVALGVTAHVLAGGLPPSGRLTVLLTAVVALLARALADREVGVGGLLLAAGAVQLGMHLALLGDAGHTEPGPMMLAGHVAAVVLLACWLRCGEAALWSLLRLATARLRAVLALAVTGFEPPAAAVRFALRTTSDPRRPRPALLLPARRGPPAPGC